MIRIQESGRKRFKTMFELGGEVPLDVVAQNRNAPTRT